jgi:hypothetical protein
VIFTDEALLTRDGIQIFTINLCGQILSSHHQQRISINIWAGICGDDLFEQAHRAELQSFLGKQEHASFLGRREPQLHASWRSRIFSLVGRRCLNRKVGG